MTKKWGRMMEIIPVEAIEKRICLIRGQKVLLDSDLAELYRVQTRSLVQAVKRNSARFPSDFMFQLTQNEFDSLRSQSVISKRRGGRRYPPYVFTEQGIAMLSSVLQSERAVQVNIAIMRIFVRLREITATHRELARKLKDIEKRLGKHDEQFRIVFEAIRQLMITETKPKKKIGFEVKEPKRPYGKRTKP
jgi:phage regulator Rha-like protein